MAANGDAGRVAAERGNVGLHPFQGGDDVEEAIVSGAVVRGFSGEERVGEEAKRAKAEIEGDDDNVLRG